MPVRPTGHYHGTVIWSWQQALLAAGIARQLRRPDLPQRTTQALQQAQRVIWQAIREAWDWRAAEFWTFAIEAERYRAAPAQGAGPGQESNAVQLWSVVYLGVRPPDPD